MAEMIEEEQSTSFDASRILSIVRRRHMQFLVPFLLGWLLVWSVSWVLPVRYKSSTLILVEQPTMPKNYVLPNINDDLQAELNSITQQILSRTRLLIIVDKLHLYQGGKRPLTPDEAVAQMRADTGIDLVRDDQTGTITAFRVSFSASNARIAQQVTSELTNLFISENLRVRQEESQDTTQFLQDQMDAARTNLAQQDAKVKEFEAAHEGELPTQQAANLQILSGLQSQLQNEEDALNTAKQQRTYLQSLIEQYRSVQSTSHAANGTPTGLASIDQQLSKLRAQLADLSSHYTDQYPDVQNAKAEIARTEKMRASLLAELKNRPHAAANNSGAPDALEASESAPLLQLQGQFQANMAEISNREQAITGLTARINLYQSRLNAEPESEQQLDDLTRGLNQTKANYDELLKKENDSQMATSMEQMQQGQRFSVLDPPTVPSKPDFPNRLKFCAMGIGVGLTFGLLLVGALEFMDNRLHTDREIKDLLPVAVISEIPEIVNAATVQETRRRMMVGWATAALVGFTVLAGSAISFLHR
jgi:polysaccharide chain length determinant protein (PEP-CTERM system associated)